MNKQTIWTLIVALVFVGIVALAFWLGYEYGQYEVTMDAITKYCSPKINLTEVLP